MGTIDGTDWTGVTIDGDSVQEITVDGDVVWTASLVDSFEGETIGTDPSGWTTAGGEVTDAVGASDGTKAYANNTAVSSGSAFLETSGLGGRQPDQITYAYRETSGSGGHNYVARNTSGNTLFRIGTANPQVIVDHAAEATIMESAPSPNYGAWRRFTLTFDWANGTFDATWDDVGGSTASVTETGLSMMATADGISSVAAGDYPFTDGGTSVTGDEWCDEVWGVSPGGN